jgi:uncharacterized membrane protein
MSNTPKPHVLFVGESVFEMQTHLKGFMSYTTSNLEDNIDIFVQALNQAGVDLTFMRNHEVPTRFPMTLEALAAYDAVIISDAPSDSFLLHPRTLAGERLPNRLKLINEYVRAGGGLLMIGGWMTFSGMEGKARYASSPLAEILPVKMLSHDDRVEAPEGLVPLVAQPNHPILAGIPTEWPFFLGYNKLLPGSGQILMTIAGDPFLAVDTVGKGRVGAFASDVLPHWGPKEFIEWTYYSKFWGQLVKWLANK